ncbi:hypothetical protein HZU77_008390 [Neisseriaceae bacterium TC5R-5]|nr:hypothetical protein [Neisseriaceae bacterium TC5R-5]
MGPYLERRERYPGGQLYPASYKNQEGSTYNGPSHARNSTLYGNPYGSTMWMSFKLKTTNFFGPRIGNALVLMRSFIQVQPGVQGGGLYGRGLAIFPANPGSPQWNGVKVARFDQVVSPSNASYAGQNVLQDGQEYTFNIHAGYQNISYWIQNSSGAQIASGQWADSSPINHTGYAFAITCEGTPNGSCEFPSGNKTLFEVRYSNISMGWF